MSQFDVLEKGSLLLFGEQGPQLDEISRHFLIEFGFEAGHFLKRSRDRGLIEDAGRGEKLRELLPLRVHRGLAGEKARVVRHRDLMDLRLLVGGEVEDLERIVRGGLNRDAPGMHAVGDRGGNQHGEHDGGEGGSESHYWKDACPIDRSQG